MPLILPHDGKEPRIAADAYIAPTAVIIGDVTIESRANVWFGAVIRGDIGRIVVGERTSIQDNVVVHVNRRHDTLIGPDVLVGHGVVLEGCRIEAGCLLGMNATILSGVRIGAQSLVAAGAVVREGSEIPPGVLVAGVPGKVKGPLTDELRGRMVFGANHYQEIMDRYLAE